MRTKYAAYFLLVLAGISFVRAPLFAQAPPSFPPDQLDQLVARVALYPDPLLAQILTASTFPDQIPDAARWADQHHYLTGQALADAIQGDQVPWDPSVQALLPFPSVLEMMASDMRWTTRPGQRVPGAAAGCDGRDAAGASQGQGFTVISGPTARSWSAEDLTSRLCRRIPAFLVVPAYDPGIVFFAPRPGFVVGGAIRFGFGVTLGGFFRPWGWGPGFYGRFDWGGHALFINNARWGRTWVNRGAYVHPYPGVRRFAPGARPAEQHALHERSTRERQDAREGRRGREEHRR